MSDFGGSQWVKGRKKHVCAGCGSVIPVGELHFQFKGMWEGDWQNWRAHAECHELWDSDGCGEITGGFSTPERLLEIAT